MSRALTGADYQRAVERARSALTGVRPGDPGVHRVLSTSGALGRIRREVAESWHRSALVLGGRDQLITPRVAPEEDLRDVRREHPLAPVLPIVRRLLVEPAQDAGLIVALGSAEGQLLWVEGDPAARRRAEAMGFLPGADWSEDAMGTSAPGMALYSGRPVQVSRAEHFSPSVHPWSCSAVPLRDPHSGAILGVLDLTGGDEAVSPLALPLLGAAAEAVQSAWREHHVPVPHPGETGTPGARPASGQVSGSRAPSGAATLLGPPGTSGPAAGHDGGREGLVRVTGGLPPRLAAPDGGWLEVSGKHAEILTLLDWYGTGLDGAELEDLLYGHAAGATLRAEVHRLRRFLTTALPARPEVTLRSRPYRLEGPLATDATLARDALRRGDVTAALAHAAGPVLPRSAAPGIVEIRRQLEADLRESVVGNAGIEDLWAYAGRPEGAGDLEVWMTALRLLPPDSSRRSLAVSAVERLQAEES